MDNSLKLTELQPVLLVQLLQRSGSRLITEESLAADIAAGAPQNENGSINLITYAAWLAKGEEDGSDTD
ncbi:MAG: hypothetical protein J6S98_09575 [Lentisphaeria bacterium]|jgi:hypothetical protein|nr:hypothetical protein [Lentisphaeria bacterium]